MAPSQATFPAAADTAAGSAADAAAACYLVCCCAQVFGAAACLSTHWVPGGGVPVAWLAQGNIPDPATHR
jgi:hypothetical protein